MDIPLSVQEAGHEAVQTYKKAIKAGSSARFAEMVALASPPATKGTDRNFMQGRCNNQQLDEMPLESAKWLSKEAREAGINISGKYYCGGIADKRGWKDPEAWVSSRDDIEKVAIKRRLHVSGAVDYDPGDAPPPKRPVMNEKIMKRELKRARRTNKKASDKELRSEIIKKHGYNPSKKKS